MKGEDEAVCEGASVECNAMMREHFKAVHRSPPPAVLHFERHGRLGSKDTYRQQVTLKHVGTSCSEFHYAYIQT